MPLVGDAAEEYDGAGERLKEADFATWESLNHAKLFVLTGGSYPTDPELGGLHAILEWLSGSGMLEWVVRSPGM